MGPQVAVAPAIHSLRFNLPTPKPAIIGVPGVQLVPLGPYGKELRWDPTPDLRTKVGDKVRHTIKSTESRVHPKAATAP